MVVYTQEVDLERGRKEMEIKRIGQQERGQSIILYGPPNAGKTWQCGTLPHDETLILDVDGGIVTLSGTNMSVFTIDEDLSQLHSIYEYIRTQKHPFKYVVIDNFSELERFMLSAIGKQRNVDYWAQLDWGRTAQKLREYMRLFRDLTDMGINVIFISWDMQVETEEGPRVCPMLMKSVTEEFSGLMDNVWYLKPDPNLQSKDRYLITESASNIIAKTRVPVGQTNPLAKVTKNPNLFECITKLMPYYSKAKETKNDKAKGRGGDGVSITAGGGI